MSTEDHVSELLPAYALDILDGEELRSVGEHIAACAACRAELQLFEEVLEARVVRTTHIASGDRCCTYRIEPLEA